MQRQILALKTYFYTCWKIRRKNVECFLTAPEMLTNLRRLSGIPQQVSKQYDVFAPNNKLIWSKFICFSQNPSLAIKDQD